ncbi:IclR family transcriptional regulator [Desulfuromonas sp. AOP6]|uniref:IclR family transcriptional regulator n=1 Tax=Desulfuromonas sp. AOP6 TaxID=1566351 RepID=UPI0012742A0A|nr:IclR family transcriptional regulator [Desulfuromonas sp. AOP6]BCA80610.1 IclR family transcriptional regulator [Desulfuromonas sp. AOP6]
MRVRERGDYSVQSVENALMLLEALGDQDEEITLSQLSERLGMNKASVFRLLATFESRGYVERRKGAGGYGLGPLAYEVGQKLLSRMDLLRKSKPVMEALAREYREAVYLVVRRGDEALFLDGVDCSQQVKVVSLVGKRFPLGGCAAGRVLQAFEHGVAGAAGSCLEAVLLPAEDAAILECGACADLHGVGQGSAALAVPLLASGGRVVGALTVVGPDFRLDVDGLSMGLLASLCGAGDVISSRMGFISS